MSKRTQLTLFVDESQSAAIEKIRREFNPEQYILIKSHVTLCRENELEQMDTVLENLASLNHPSIFITFGAAERFADGKGLWMPAVDDHAFQALRQQVLRGTVQNPTKRDPHITLMHPRNSNCTDECFGQIQKMYLPHRLAFASICLIGQADGGKWTILKEFRLA